MANYVVGDLHGCFLTLKALLELIRFDPERDHLSLVGDLVNRGPRSLDVLRWVRSHEDSVSTVLGNHDLHLIARYHGAREAKASDTFDDILGASDCDSLLNWLLHRPLLLENSGHIIVHAGIHPLWNRDCLLANIRKAEHALRTTPRQVLSARGSLKHASESELRFTQEAHEICRTLTLIRCCGGSGAPEYGYSGSLEHIPSSCKPWFSFQEIVTYKHKFVFGHWARLGLFQTSNAICLDSGCAYGGSLTGIRLDDGRLFQVHNCESPSS